jgi:SAM-dependent methyltransferase
MSAPEDSYGYQKCIAFVSEALSEFRPRKVLDMGCGTGQQLTWPLAKLHSDVAFTGVDADGASIEHARRAFATSNLRYLRAEELPADERFDLIIASEVIEHVERPVSFLRELQSRLAPGGRIIVTVPNGYGPSEVASLFETLFALTGLLRIARTVKRSLWRSSAAAPKDTFAVSPHINFFSWREVRRAVQAAGLVPARYRGRTLLCGFGFDSFIRGERMARWNADLADSLPPLCVSGWMYVLQRADSGASGSEYRPGPMSRLRRWLNKKRWGLR